LGSLAFSPDSNTLAVGVWDRTINLWHVTDRNEPIRFVPARRNWSRAGILAFSPDGRTLVAGGAYMGQSPVLATWDYSGLNDLRADPVAAACAISGGGLSEEEWARYVPEMAYQRTCDD
jgi:WD40 repeat protein